MKIPQSLSTTGNVLGWAFLGLFFIAVGTLCSMVLGLFPWGMFE